MKEYKPPKPPVEVNQEISISSNSKDAPSEFGDEDALLSVATEAYEVSSNGKSSITASITRHSARSYTSQNLKPSELRPKAKQDPAKILSDPRSVKDSNQTKALKLDSNQLVARDKDIATLKACFQRLIKKEEANDIVENASERSAAGSSCISKELVLISGQSGVGKTSIIELIEDEDIVKVENSICITGKFTMISNDRPYLGISEALNKAFQKVDETDSKSSIFNAIQTKLEDEIPLLSALLPSLREKINGDTADVSKAPADLDYEELENGLERLKYDFRILIRLLCQEFCPLVLVLDDLQWADLQSLQVLDFLISDVENRNKLMIVGTYRSDEVDENSLLYNKIMALNEKKESYEYRVTEIQLLPFSVEAIDAIIHCATSSSTKNDCRTKDLAELCLKRTLGNPFFVFQFLKMLHTERLLTYDSSSEQWTWDLATVEDSTMSTANVVVLLQERMAKMPKQVQIILQYAAYLGSSFREATLELIWSTYGTMRALGNKKPLPELLEIIIRESFFEEIVGGYRWVHDKVQEAALYFTGEVRPNLQLDIGTTLYYCLNKEQLDDDLFNVVDLINNGNIKKRNEFASVNLRAAEKARVISAFESAAKYADHGIELLTENRWSENRLMSLKLYTIATEMQMILGNIDLAEKYRDEILMHGNYSITEMLPLKLCKAKSLAEVALHFDKAVSYGLAVLKELDCRLILARSLVPVQALVKITRLISKVKKLDANFFEGMETMSDPKLRAIASITNYIKYAAFNAGDVMLAMMCICKEVDLTLKHGLNEFSGVSFCGVGGILILVQQDYESARKILQWSMSLQKAFGKKNTSECAYTAYTFAWPWIIPLRDCLDPVREGYTIGVRFGEIDYALWCLISHTIMIPYALGKPIETILAECARVAAQAEEAKQLGQILCTKVFWQALTNLRLCAEEGGTKLEGKIYSKTDDDEKNSKIHLAVLHHLEGELLLFQGDYEAAAERAISKGHLYAAYSAGMFFQMSEAFNRGVALYAMARKTNKRVYKKEANNIRKQVAKWATPGNPNVVHFNLLLQAEQQALNKKYDAADESYRKAITVATDGSHLQYIALFHERYADFLLNVQSRKEDSVHHVEEAARYFEEWGASARAYKLRQSLK